MKIARYPKEERQKRVFKRSKPYSPIPPTKKKKINKNNKKKRYAAFTGTNRYEILIGIRAYKYFRLNRKHKYPILFLEWKKLCRAFFKVARRHVLENEAGLFIKNFGYFFIARNLVLSQRIKYNNISAEGRKHTPMFAPIRKDTVLDTWLMDYNYNHSFETQLYDNIAKGTRYKMAYSNLYAMFGEKQTNLTLIEKTKNGNNAE